MDTRVIETFFAEHPDCAFVLYDASNDVEQEVIDAAAAISVSQDWMDECAPRIRLEAWEDPIHSPKHASMIIA